jgi:hypothetical protein
MYFMTCSAQAYRIDYLQTNPEVKPLDDLNLYALQSSDLIWLLAIDADFGSERKTRSNNDLWQKANAKRKERPSSLSAISVSGGEM